jgi:hypothetical protein
VTAQADRVLVTNALDRELCIALSDKYEMVAPAQPAARARRQAGGQDGP